jgi:hypothetical protein
MLGAPVLSFVALEPWAFWVPVAEKPSTGNAAPALFSALTASTVSALAAATEPAMRSRKVRHTVSALLE